LDGAYEVGGRVVGGRVDSENYLLNSALKSTNHFSINYLLINSSRNKKRCGLPHLFF
jgi:hypothetical protein